MRTGKLIVFGSWNAEERIEGKNCPQNPGECNKVVEKVGRILKDAGF